MKRSSFTKEYNIKGVVRSVKGSIIIEMDSRREQVVGHNPIIHEDYPRTISYHKITTYIDGQVYKESEVKTEEALLDKTKDMVEDLKKEMNEKANTVPAKTFAEKIQEILNN